MKKRFYLHSILLFGFFAFFLFSCIEEAYVPKEGEVKMEVEICIGEEFQFRTDKETHHFLPYIVNEGAANVNNRLKRIALISRKINAGDNIYIKPVAKLKYNRLGQEKEIILAIPAQEKYRTMQITSYGALITEYYSTKQLIEYWYTNRYGLGGVSNMRWIAL
ncbi:MAG: hypothetical protein V3V00_12145 [Saprospiraceae bacterium]